MGKRGSSELVAETAEGRHFDLVQRLSFLEHSAFDDKRVQGMIRTKAETLRKETIDLLQNADLKDREVARDPKLETASTCSPESVPSITSGPSVISSSGSGPDDVASDVLKHEPESKRTILSSGFGSDDV